MLNSVLTFDNDLNRIHCWLSEAVPPYALIDPGIRAGDPGEVKTSVVGGSQTWGKLGALKGKIDL